jgi:YVTN family beta-propeller protein
MLARRVRLRVHVYLAAALLLCSVSLTAQGQTRVNVGPQSDGRIVVPTNQILSPLGRQITFPGRPVDLALRPDGKVLAVLDRKQVFTLDTESGQVIDAAKIGAASYLGLEFTRDGRRLYASTIPASRSAKVGAAIVGFSVQPDGKLGKPEPISVELPAGNEPEGIVMSADGVTLYGTRQLPAGFAIAPDGRRLWVALNLANELGEVDLARREVVRRIPVGSAPYDVQLVGDKAYVSNSAGRRPQAGDATGPSGRARPVKVDSRNIAAEGSVSIVDLKQGRVIKEIVVGRYASSMAVAPGGKYVAVANANSDTVSVIDTADDRVVEIISARPLAELPFGSGPNALAFSADGGELFIANGTNNAVAVVKFDPPHSSLQGCFPTGWYPGSLALDPARNRLFVGNVKGIGSRDTLWQGKRVVKGKQIFGFNSHDYLGSISSVPLPDDDELRRQTTVVLANNRSDEIFAAHAAPRAGIAPRPVPERHGEPSVFKHVLYIIKENRTYDQVFGDIERGEGDPSLCIFGREVTPNHHRLADEFVLLDNFYCSGVLSADGHQWTDEAFVTDYIEKAFGGFPRSYPYDGGDALAYAASGFIWDAALAKRKSLRIYGEFVEASIRWRDGRRGKPTFLDCYRDYLAGDQAIEIRGRATIKTLEPYVCPTFIGFPGTVSDAYRASEFIKELKNFEQRGDLPELSIMLLPNDHTAGTKPGMPTPEAAVADNDLALGRIVEAISHSRFWKDTCILVVQDDPQNGFDHIDGHRTVALVISPYTKRHHVDSTNYNQTGMVRTIELLLGLAPMNQLDASATPMRNCFAPEPDFTPYKALPSNIPLDRLNPKLADIRDPRQLHWAELSQQEDFDEVDEADEDTLNRILWFAARGRDDTYPAWAISASDGDDDDD